MKICRNCFYRDPKLSEMFINLGGLDSVCCLFSHKDEMIRRDIINFFFYELEFGCSISIFENPINVEQIKLFINSESTAKEVFIKFQVIYC